MIDTADPPERAFLLGLQTPRAKIDVDDSLDELAALAAAADARVVGRSAQRRRAPDPNSWVGKGKLDEVALECGRVAADLLVCDDELSPTQQRALEKATKLAVIDRSALILDIFARHARTREGRLQVELAQLQYRLPRLAGGSLGLSRLGGGIGTRGPGETKLESDRQVIRRRIQELKGRLEELSAQRERSRRSRAAEGLFLAALVGYTNAGKSTLLNVLSGSEVLVADQPFATLDPTTRRIALPNGTLVLLSDTVGFVNKLPPTLVAAFHATLEELDGADLLVHVADVSHPNVHEQAAVVRDTLRSLGLADRATLLVLNKVDALSGPEGDALREALGAEFPTALFVSASRGDGLGELRERIAELAAAAWQSVAITLPYASGAMVQRIRERGALHRADYSERGIEIEADVPPSLAAELHAAR